MTAPPQGPPDPQEPPRPPVVPPVAPPVAPPAVPRTWAQSRPPEQRDPAWHQGVDGSGVTLRISRRVLWVGEAVYPLHNVVRVQSFVLKPDRAKAAKQFGLWMAVLAVLFSLSRTFGNGAPLIFLLAMIFLVAQLVRRLTRPDVFAMAVETSGTPAAVVTMAHREDLRGLVRRIVDAIEHPEREFSVYVHQLQVKLGDYHFGDTVNINGGSGNKGILK